MLAAEFGDARAGGAQHLLRRAEHDAKKVGGAEALSDRNTSKNIMQKPTPKGSLCTKLQKENN